MQALKAKRTSEHTSVRHVVTPKLASLSEASFCRPLDYPTSWTKHYMQNHYERFDPVVVRALRHNEPFEWGLGVDRSVCADTDRQLFEEAARFGIRYGLTIPVHDSKGAIAAVTFCRRRATSSFRTFDKGACTGSATDGHLFSRPRPTQVDARRVY